ncbi:MAG: NAD(P)-dependent oxidoreductase [Candidatus Pacebacteria bacterium]|nr:NAD(P)-dependent oxidoreductase [Candidatus Paceibacterota bacterium]MCF7862783.1 NAD(P)-dependent oxidoreductase [Candidatus Paceibacterota bacterium]
MKKQKLGFIGLGLMGKYMTLNLLKNKYQVVGYNRSKKVLNELKKSGLIIAQNPKEIALRSEIIILMLPSSKETGEVIFGKSGLIEGLRKGQVVIDMSTSNPAETKKIMEVLKKKGVFMMDAPVSRGQKAAVAGVLSIMVGGDKKIFNKCLPIFKAMGEYVVYLGSFGSGLYVKALNNFLFAMNLLASSQGLMMIKKNKIDLKKAIEVIEESSGNNTALSPSIKNRLGEKHPSIGFYLKHMAKDMKIFNDVVKDQKIYNTLAKPVSDFFAKMAKLHTGKDSMYLFEHYVVKSNKK